MSERVRVTVSMSPEVLVTFKTMADAAGISVSRCLGDWLADTADSAQLVAQKMQEARAAPITVMRELQSMIHGTSQQAAAVMDDLRAGRLRGRPGRERSDPRPPAPSSNTGLKSPRKGKGRS